jgi:hypothetical protein
MKNTLLALVAVLLIAGCGENQRVTTWLLTSQHTDLTTRVGLEAVPGLEAGVTAKWHPTSDIAWGPEPNKLGPYFILTGSWEGFVIDTEPEAPPPFPGLEGLVITPYVGADFVDSVDNDNFSNLEPNWIVGTKTLLAENIAIVAEYIDGDEAEPDVNIGVFIAY